MIEGFHYPLARSHLTHSCLVDAPSRASRNIALPGLSMAICNDSALDFDFLPNRPICFTIGLNRGRIKIFPRSLFLIILLFSLLGCQPEAGSLSPVTTTSAPHANDLNQREYVVHQQVALVNEGTGQPEKQNIWIALIRDFPPYQEVRSMEISPNKYQLVVDEYGNHYAEFDFSGQHAGTTQLVKIDYQVVVNELTYDLSTCQGELLDTFLQPELHIETANPQIVALASELAQGNSTVCQQVRAFYDYIDKI